MRDASEAGDVAILGDVGRKWIRFALADEAGRFRPETVRRFDSAASSTISGAVSMFQRELGLSAMPKRSAFAVAGLVRGDTISITNTRWFLSRSGLAAMFQHQPLIINDFAAEAWALAGSGQRPREVLTGAPDLSVDKPGCYLVIGMTSGLGTAVVSRDEVGAVTVLPTEAGHAGFVPGSAEMARLLGDVFPGRFPLIAEELLSAPGLLALYSGLARLKGAAPGATSPEDVTRLASTDPVARHACTLLCEAFWSQAGNLAVTLGAWDGVFITGRLSAALLPMLRQPDVQRHFALKGKYQRQLEQVPRAYTDIENAELLGVCAALREHEAKRDRI